MIINRTYPPSSKLCFIAENILPFLYRVARIHFTRLIMTKQKVNAHKQLTDLRERKVELSNSNEKISKDEIKAIQNMEKELECIRECDITITIEEDELTDIAMSVEKVLNWFTSSFKFLVIKPIIFLVECLWNCFNIIISAMYKEITEYIKKRKMKKELLKQAVEITTA